MKRVKRLFGDLIAAAISLLILASAFALPFEAVKAAPTAAGPAEWTEPANGTGRIASCMNEEKTHDTVETETGPETDPSTRADALAQDDTGEEFAEDIYVPDTEAETCEEYVEVIPEREDPPAGEIDVLIREAAERYGLPWELVSAVVWAESRYDPNAVSGTPDYGLMQVTASVCAAYGLNKDNRLDPAANLDAGCRILREKIDESGGDLTIALMKYNEGDAGYLENIAAGIWSTKYTEDVLGKYYEILREG